MTKEEIIKLAQEVGLIRAGEHHTEPARWGISEITDFYQRAVAHEREACAKVCEEIINELSNGPVAYDVVTAETKFIRGIGETIGKPFVEAIRARGEP